MSIKATVRQHFGNRFDKITEERITQHGEPGRELVLTEGSISHTFFFADDRKITDEHALDIVRSYLSDPENTAVE